MINIIIIIIFTIIWIILWFFDQKHFKLIEYKQDIIWDYIISRAQLEFLNKEMGTINSPIEVNNDIKNMYAPIAKDLKDHYKKVGVRLTDRELFEIIFKKYGEWIVKNVCLPYKLQNGACIIAAIAIAKED